MTSQMPYLHQYFANRDKAFRQSGIIEFCIRVGNTLSTNIGATASQFGWSQMRRCWDETSGLSWIGFCDSHISTPSVRNAWIHDAHALNLIAAFFACSRIWYVFFNVKIHIKKLMWKCACRCTCNKTTQTSALLEMKFSRCTSSNASHTSNHKTTPPWYSVA